MAGIIEDKWLTIDEAIIKLKLNPKVHGVKQTSDKLTSYTKSGKFVRSVRIFNGSEHKKAKANHVLDID